MVNLRDFIPVWKIKALDVADDLKYSQSTIDKILHAETETECDRILVEARKHDNVWKRYGHDG